MPDSAPAHQAEEPRPPARSVSNPASPLNNQPPADCPTPADEPLSEQLAGAGPGGPFGAQLEPVLRKVCNHQLSPVRWFRTDWQRGGALTGYADFTTSDGRSEPVVVKLPVAPSEHDWLQRLQHAPDLVPRLYAHGEELGGYDFAWVVMEHLPHGPLSPAWDGCELDLLIDCLVRFHKAASQFPIDHPPADEDWPAILRRAAVAVERAAPANQKQWKKALQGAEKKLDHWLELWTQRPIDQWCHGDVHLANALTREPAPAGPALLIDFALTRPGHWVEDAVYLEHQYWARRERLAGRKICQLVARYRKQLSLPHDPHWSQWAAVRRALLALSAPATPHHLNDPLHLQSALEILEKELASK